MNLTYINLSLVAYFLACIFYLINTVFRSKLSGKIATLIFALGLVFHTVVVVNRWYVAKHPPFTNLYESLIFFAWSVVLIYIISEFFYKIKLLGIPASLLALLAMGYASLLDSTIQPLLPALQSNWISIHVITYFFGYAAVAISFAASLIYLIITRGSSVKTPLASTLDILSYRFIAFAFPFLTIGLTTGAVWANVAWGNYWSWDPKETWSLITWLIYAVYLHMRLVRGWQEKKAAYLSVIGFLAVLFTFLGVSLFLSGLHSYI
ncbi:MAG: c-type cytochrome biogenesis protein CcsB [Candidatus Omnitrophota bacterium]